MEKNIRIINPNEKRIFEKIHIALKNKLIFDVYDTIIVTDDAQKDYYQVFPLHPENIFFIDEINKKKIKNAKVLEFGIGSGILSIFAIKLGAKSVDALEINPKAKIYAGFNIFINNLEEKINIIDGNEKDIFKTINGKKYDYFISNPPFEPIENIPKHSFAKYYGLEYVRKILNKLDTILKKNAYAQIVTFSLGNYKEPTLLIKLVKKIIKNKELKIIVNPIKISIDDYLNSFEKIIPKNKLKEYKKNFLDKNLSHLYLCMLHYENKKGNIIIKKSKKNTMILTKF